MSEEKDIKQVSILEYFENLYPDLIGQWKTMPHISLSMGMFLAMKHSKSQIEKLENENQDLREALIMAKSVIPKGRFPKIYEAAEQALKK